MDHQERGQVPPGPAEDGLPLGAGGRPVRRRERRSAAEDVGGGAAVDGKIMDVPR